MSRVEESSMARRARRDRQLASLRADRVRLRQLEAAARRVLVEAAGVVEPPGLVGALADLARVVER